MRLLFLLFLSLLSGLAAAQVNLRNGNLAATAQDFEWTWPHGDLSIRRTSNSLHPERGWFGWGWGSPFETRVVVMPDGSAVVRENGLGAMRYFDAPAASDASDRIAQFAAARDGLSAAATQALQASLRRDEALRVRTVERIGMRIDTVPGTAWRGRTCGRLERTANGFLRRDCEGGIDRFDAQERLVRREAQKSVVEVRYEEGKPGRPVALRNAAGQQLELSWTPNGLIAEVRGQGRTVRYDYNAREELVAVHGSSPDKIDYSYDAEHRLTGIAYPDSSSRQIRYDADGRVASVRERDGETVAYAYGADADDPNRIWTRVVRATEGEPQSVIKHISWRMNVDARGASEVVHTAIVEGNRRSETFHDEKGRIVRRKNGNDETRFAYDPVSGKMTQVISNGVRTDFRYDKRGELLRAQDSEGRTVDLAYAADGSISTLTAVDREHGKRQLSFRYNAMGKPVTITLQGVGKIDVTYDEAGEITKVDSAAGMKMALEVTQVFQQLLSIVSPAGVRLGLS